jgi:hypothetical protein
MFQDFDPLTLNIVTLFPDHTATASYGVVQDDDYGGGKFAITGTYSWILPGQVPADIFVDPDVIAHFTFLIPLLPLDWTFLISGAESFIKTEGLGAGFVAGIQTKTNFSVDPDAVAFVPIPAALPLFSVALAGLWRMRRKASRINGSLPKGSDSIEDLSCKNGRPKNSFRSSLTPLLQNCVIFLPITKKETT